MKALKTLFKIMTVLAACAGAIYVIVVYGDRIVAWAKKLLGRCPFVPYEDLDSDFDFDFDQEFSPVVQVPVAEAPAAETASEETVAVNEAEPVAEDRDFEG